MKKFKEWLRNWDEDRFMFAEDKEMPEEEFLREATPWFERSAAKGYDYALLAKLLQGRIEIFGDIPEKVSFIEEYGPVNPELYFHKKLKTDACVAK